MPSLGPLPRSCTMRFLDSFGMHVANTLVVLPNLIVAGFIVANFIASQCVTMLQLSAESTELVELRELREDVERRERAQAAVIENQAKRLDELETLYKVNSLLMCTHGKQRLLSASAGPHVRLLDAHLQGK